MRAAHALLAFLALSASAAADVLIVDPAGSQGFTQVQAAVNAAQDGDLILVRSGSYFGFTLNQRSLTVRADVNATVQVDGSVLVSGTPADGVVVLAGLSITALPATFNQPGPDALTLQFNDGFVRVQDCIVAGGYGNPSVSGVSTPGGAGCVVLDSLRTAIVGSKLSGGGGGGDPFTVTFGGVGGHGLRTSGSGVVLYDCTLTGGFGGVADLFPNQIGGDGGIGCEVFDFGVFASNTTIRGGGGGYGWAGGDGGDGLVVGAGAQAQLLDGVLLGGTQGNGEGGPDGAFGQAQSGAGPVFFLPGSARELEAPALGRDGKTIDVTVRGEPGDQVWIVPGKSPAHLPAIALGGVWLVARPVFLTKAPLVVLGASGEAVVSLPVSALTSSEPSRELYLQAFARTQQGQIAIGSPAHVSLVDCASLSPDCNGSGDFDTCDLLAGTSSDCDGNSIPDECEIDCNGNGVSDVCDIAGGSSADQNQNGVPDECEPQNATLYVNVFAPPGGDGSITNPFQTIGVAIAASIDGYTIQVADGVYKGSQNRNLSFGGRDIVVQSANGSGACTIDCQDVGSAFLIEGSSSAASRIQGFTILNGNTGSWGGGIRVLQADTEIRDIVFLSCNANQGGGLDLTTSDSVVRDCRFQSGSAQRGGGLSIHGNSSPDIAFCTFVGNNVLGGAADGGGIYIANGLHTRLSHLTLIDNHASEWGGGIYLEASDASVSNCLLLGNSAKQGSAIRAVNAHLYLVGTTLDGNLATQQGAIQSSNTGLQVRDLYVQDSILWDDPLGNAGLVRAVSSNIAVLVERSDVRGGLASASAAAGSTLTWGPGNLDIDPLFADADGPDNNAFTFEDNDYRLGAGSPCIDAGDNALVLADVFDLDGDANTSEPTPIDLDGNARFVDDPTVVDTGVGTPPIVDLGAYERP